MATKSSGRFPVSFSVLGRARRARRRWYAADDDDERDDDPAELDPTLEITPLGALASPAEVLLESDLLVTARAVLLETRVPAIAVVDTARALRGVVTRTDVLRVLARSPDATVGDAMSGFVFALPQHARVEHAAALMAHEHVGQIIVTGDNGELVGMVSAVDVARELAVRAGFLAA